MKPFNRERFLFWMLAGIFIFEGLLFVADLLPVGVEADLLHVQILATAMSRRSA